ncbi:MAG: hypothetical protein ACE1Y4_09345 [Lysobacterales bacterium]
MSAESVERDYIHSWWPALTRGRVPDIDPPLLPDYCKQGLDQLFI